MKRGLGNQPQPFLFIPIPDNRTLTHFLANPAPFQRENHIAGALKESGPFQPAHSAFAVIKPYELLYHFPAAILADMGWRAHHSPMSMPNFSAISSGESPASLAFASTARMEMG